MATYFATLLADEWGEAVHQPAGQLTSFQLMYDEETETLNVVRRATDGVDGVEVAMHMHVFKYGQQLVALLRHEDSPFRIAALCKRDPTAAPLALDVFVNSAALESMLDCHGTFPGEAELVAMLTCASKAGLLARRCVTTTHSQLPYTPVSRTSTRAKRMKVEKQVMGSGEVVTWMQTHEGSKAALHYLPCFVDMPHSKYVFCLKEFVFVPRRFGTWDSVTLSAGAIVGDRNTGKTEMIKQLIAATRGGPPRVTTPVPPFLQSTPCTLLVVPPYLLHQWQRALACTVRTAVVSNKRTLQLFCRADTLAALDVVLVPFPFFVSSLKKSPCKHRARAVQVRAHEAGEQPRRLDWMFWRRLVIDEACQLYAEWARVLRKPSTQVRAQFTWLLQGGVDVTSVAPCALLNLMVNRAVLHDVDALQDRLLSLTCTTPPRAVQCETVLTDLSPPERQAYDVLRGVHAPVLELLQVCCGDMTPMMTYMRPASSWDDAVKHATELIAQYKRNGEEQLEEWWSDQDDNDELPSGTDAADAAVASPAASDHDQAEEAEPTEPADADDELTDLDDLMQEVHDALHTTSTQLDERLTFLSHCRDTLMAPGSQPDTCSICLTNVCDCLCVCGHMLCHECMVHLFQTAKKKEAEELEEHGLQPDASMFAQCPHCRWDVEPHEVFWNVGSTPGGKYSAIQQSITQAAAAAKNTVVVVTMPELLHTLLDWLKRDGAQVQACTASEERCKQALTWFDSGHGRTLLLYYHQLYGLKLQHVHQVLLVHGLSRGIQQLDGALMLIKESVTSAQLSVYNFLARDTIEESMRA
jgi:hypothetical protein